MTEPGDEWRERSATARARADRYAQAQHRIEAVRCTDVTKDGSVSVTVDAAGAITDLRIAETPECPRGARLAGEIMSTMRRAQSRVPGEVAAIMRAEVGDETELSDAVVSTFGARCPEPEDEQPGRPTRPGRPRRDDPDDDYFVDGVLR